MMGLRSRIFKTHFYYNKQLNLTISVIHKRETNWHTIGTTLARFCSFPVKASMLYLVQSKICKAAVFHPGRRLFSSERRWFYFAKGNFQHNVQSSREGISPYGQAWQDPGIHTEKWTWGRQLFQYGSVHLHSGAPAGIHPGPVQHHLHQTGTWPLCRPDGEADPALRRH